MADQVELSRAALAAHFFAAKDKSRPVIGQLWSENGRITAADGFAAIQVTPALGPVPDGVRMSKSEAAAVIRNTSIAQPDVTLTTQDDGTRTATTVAKPKITYTLDEPVDGIPPSITTIFESNATKGDVRTVVISVDILEQVVKAVKACTKGYGEGAIQFRIRDAHDAVEARAMTDDGDRLRMILMPMVSEERFIDFDPLPANGGK